MQETASREAQMQRTAKQGQGAPNYKMTMYACFTGYIVQAIVNNFVPHLFVTFQTDFQIPLSQITMLITVNFMIQLLIDLLSAGFIDKIVYRASAILAHVCTILGFLLLTVLPGALPNAFAGILIAVVIYVVGGGLLEVLVSPIIEACPTDNKEKAMSLLHSFYCWGHVGVVLLSTLFFAVFGIAKWRILALAGDAMLDIGVYALSVVRSFMEEAPEFIVSQWKEAPTGVDEQATMLLQNTKGQMATVALSMHSKQPKRAMISCEKDVKNIW